MENNQLPFKENTALTGPGESFPIPLAYKGWPLYFNSLEHVKVASSIQAELAVELDALFREETFAISKEGETETGRVTVDDKGEKRTFEMVITLVKDLRENYYRIESIVEVTN